MVDVTPPIVRTHRPSVAERLGFVFSLGGAAPWQILLTLALLVLSVASFLISTVFGLAVTFVTTLALTIVMPAALPLVVIAAFVFQNTVIASFTPMVASDDAFDLVRGANFVILITAFGGFMLATFLSPQRLLAATRPWLTFCLILLAVIVFYLLLGAVRGEPKDAIVYFRNTITPVACFYIALVAASWYRLDLDKGLVWVGAIAIAYGYCELFFTFDFLALFNGDHYVERQMVRQIETGYWEQTLRETGFVLRNLNDVMMVTFFNTPLFGDIFPKVFRLAGPNFHSIAFAYLLAITSVWQLCRGRWHLPLLAFPLLVVIGSKGAMVLMLLAIMTRIGLTVLKPRSVLLLFFIGAVIWISAALVLGLRSADYHVLGFLAGLRDFARNPLGQGLGLGGNLSSSVANKLDWNVAQATGAAEVPVESAVGVLLYQMGIGSFLFFGFLIALALKCRALFFAHGEGRFLFGFISITVIGVNAILQEEAVYSPLALGLCLILVGHALGSHWREKAACHPS